MSAVAASLAVYQRHVRTNRLGLWLFFGSELFLFGGLLMTRVALWGDTRPPLNQFVGFLVTTVLLASSYFMNRAEVAIAHDKRNDFLVSLIITAVLGTLFLVGVMVFEWGLIQLPFMAGEHHLTPSDGVFGAVLFAMTGMHALHVLSGVAFILIIFANGANGHFSGQKHWGVEACAIYWHYVDLVWIFFYPALYLIGKVGGTH